VSTATDNGTTLITPGESARMIEMMATEIDRLRRENAVLREKLKFYIIEDYIDSYDAEEAEKAAERDITHMVLHHEGAE